MITLSHFPEIRLVAAMNRAFQFARHSWSWPLASLITQRPHGRPFGRPHLGRTTAARDQHRHGPAHGPRPQSVPPVDRDVRRLGGLRPDGDCNTCTTRSSRPRDIDGGPQRSDQLCRVQPDQASFRDRTGRRRAGQARDAGRHPTPNDRSGLRPGYSRRPSATRPPRSATASRRR